MADVNYEILVDHRDLKVIKWILTTTDNTGAPYKFAGHYPDKVIQALGTFGSGSVKPRGTNEVTPTSWCQLNDSNETPIAITTAGMSQILENMFQFSPSLDGSTGATVTVLLCISK